jgi:hypothetical protein
VGGGDRHPRARACEIRKPEGECTHLEQLQGGWRLGKSLKTNRSLHTATLLADGRVLVVGGFDGKRGLDTSELWDPKSGAFRLSGRLRQVRWSHTAVRLADGRVLVVGGEGPDPMIVASALESAEIWDPASERWTRTDDLEEAATEATATLLPDGRVLFAGGHNPDGGQ